MIEVLSKSPKNTCICTKLIPIAKKFEEWKIYKEPLQVTVLGKPKKLYVNSNNDDEFVVNRKTSRPKIFPRDVICLLPASKITVQRNYVLLRQLVSTVEAAVCFHRMKTVV